MHIQSTRFGEHEVPENLVLNFEEGIPGFPEERAFAFLGFHPESPFAYLQSTKDPDLTFLIVDPFSFFKDYGFELDDAVAQKLGYKEGAPLAIFNIVSVPLSFEEMTANLVAPVVVSWDTRKSVQIVLQESAYTTRHRLFPFGLPKNQKKEVKD